MLNIIFERKKMALRLAACTLLLLSSARVQAQGSADELVMVKLEGSTHADSAVAAAREIQANLTAEAARSQVLEVLGDKRFQKSKSQIENKIIRQSAKYIPFVNPGPAIQQPDHSWKMTVEFRVSLPSLRKMILDAGLLTDAEGPAAVLPMISFIDREKGVSIRWWVGGERDVTHQNLAQISRAFHEIMQTELLKQGFHLIKPLGSAHSPLPEFYRNEKPSSTDVSFISDYYQAPMVMRGDLRLAASKQTPGASRCMIRMQVIQSGNGRAIGEVTRSFETEPGSSEQALRSKLVVELPEVGKDLANQVVEAWQRGTLNTNLLRLALKGQLNPKQLTEFKSLLTQNVREIKALKERMFEPGQVQFEIDYTGEMSPIVEKFKALNLTGFETRFADSTEAGVVMEVKAR